MTTFSPAGGLSSVLAGKEYGLAPIATDTSLVFVDSTVNAVVVSTRQDSHAHYLLEAP